MEQVRSSAQQHLEKYELQSVISALDLELVIAASQQAAQLRPDDVDVVVAAASIVVVHDSAHPCGVLFQDAVIRSVMAAASSTKGDLFGGKRLAVIATEWPRPMVEQAFWLWTLHPEVVHVLL